MALEKPERNCATADRYVMRSSFEGKTAGSPLPASPAAAPAGGGGEEFYTEKWHSKDASDDDDFEAFSSALDRSFRSQEAVATPTRDGLLMG